MRRVRSKKSPRKHADKSCSCPLFHGVDAVSQVAQSIGCMHAVCGMHGGMRGRQILREVNAEKHSVETEAEEDIQLD